MKNSRPQADPKRANRSIRRAIGIMRIVDPGRDFHEPALPDLIRALCEVPEPAECNRERQRTGHGARSMCDVEADAKAAYTTSSGTFELMTSSGAHVAPAVTDAFVSVLPAVSSCVSRTHERVRSELVCNRRPVVQRRTMESGAGGPSAPLSPSRPRE